MNIDPSTPNREVLIRYLETSGVNQQKEAAAEMRKMEKTISALTGELRETVADLGAMANLCATLRNKDDRGFFAKLFGGSK